MKKEEYIIQEIEKLERSKEERKTFFLSLLKSFDIKIENIKNLSDEDFEKIKQEQDRISKNPEINAILSTVGITIEELDDIDYDLIPEDISKKNI